MHITWTYTGGGSDDRRCEPQGGLQQCELFVRPVRGVNS
jgi:hypothetical protein